MIQRRGFFVHHRTEVPLTRVRAVQSTRGPIQRMFGSGDVELLVGAEDPTVLQDVPGCAAVVDALQELIESNFALHTGQPAGGAHGAATVDPAHADDTRILPGF